MPFCLTQFCNGVEELLSLFPAKTWVCDGFSVDMVWTDFLAAGDQIALDHDTFHQVADITGDQTAVQHLFTILTCCSYFLPELH